MIKSTSEAAAVELGRQQQQEGLPRRRASAYRHHHHRKECGCSNCNSGEDGSGSSSYYGDEFPLKPTPDPTSGRVVKKDHKSRKRRSSSAAAWKKCACFITILWPASALLFIMFWKLDHYHQHGIMMKNNNRANVFWRVIRGSTTSPNPIFPVITSDFETSTASSGSYSIGVTVPRRDFGPAARGRGRTNDHNSVSKEVHIKPSYGGLDVTRQRAREIHPQDDKRYHKARRKFLKRLDAGHVEDKDPGGYGDGSNKHEPNRYDHYDEVEYEDDLDGYYRPGPWSYATYPVCNSFHEVNILHPTAFSADVNVHRQNNSSNDHNNNVTLATTPYYLAHGYFRETYMLRDKNGNDDAVIKINRLFEERNFRQYDYTQTQMEALVMLQTHSSKLTMDIYGYCGTSIAVEPGDDELEDEIMPNEYAWVKQEDLEKYYDQHGGLKPQNKFTPEEKLELALAMAEGLAELHGNREGMIISHDLGLDQYLVSKKDGRLKMNDFNKARVIPWNPYRKKYGKIYSHQFYSFRAPEEIHGGWINDGSDTLSLGKMYNCLLTGLRPYYYLGSTPKANRAIVAGDYPWVDPRYKTERSYIERRLVEIMERMWQYEIEDRASIFEVVEHLRETARLAGVEARGRWR